MNNQENQENQIQIDNILNMSYSQVSKNKLNESDENLNNFIFMGIPTQVMNKTAIINDVQYVENYIAFNPIYKYLKDNNIKCISTLPTDWDRIQSKTGKQTAFCIQSEKEVMQQFSVRDVPKPEFPLRLTFCGGNNQKNNKSDQGTYFHPDLAIYVLQWMSKDYYSRYTQMAIQFYIRFQNISETVQDFVYNVQQSTLNTQQKTILLKDKQNELQASDSTKYQQDIQLLMEAIQNVDVYIQVKNPNCTFVQISMTESTSQQMQQVMSNQAEINPQLTIQELLRQLEQANNKLEEERFLKQQALDQMESERIQKEQAQLKIQQQKKELEDQRQKQCKYTGSIYNEQIDKQGILQYVNQYKHLCTLEQLQQFECKLNEFNDRSYTGQGSDPNPLKRPTQHKQNRKELYNNIKKEPKYLLQVADYIRLIECLPENVPQFDLDIFIKAQILQEGIEIHKEDLNDLIPSRLKKTKLTECEQQWFQIEVQNGRGTWNSIRFNGSMTYEDYIKEAKKEQEFQQQKQQTLKELEDTIVKYDNEINKLKQLGDSIKVAKKEKLRSNSCNKADKLKSKLIQSEQKYNQLMQNANQAKQVQDRYNSQVTQVRHQSLSVNDNMCNQVEESKNESSSVRSGMQSEQSSRPAKKLNTSRSKQTSHTNNDKQTRTPLHRQQNTSNIEQQQEINQTTDIQTISKTTCPICGKKIQKSYLKKHQQTLTCKSLIK